MLNRLPPLLLDTLVLHGALQEPLSSVGRALRVKETRAGKLAARGVARLAKRLAKTRPVPELPAALSTLLLALPDEVQTFVESELNDQTVPAKKNALVRAALRSWRWMNFERALRRLGKAAAVFAGVLLVAAFTFVSLARQGYLTNFFIRLSSRQLAKQMPEIAAPARPWHPQRQLPAPAIAAQLYSLTNVWTAKLSLTPEQWKRLQPSRVPPVFNMRGADGEMVLRNPKARRSGLGRRSRPRV